MENHRHDTERKQGFIKNDINQTQKEINDAKATLDKYKLEISQQFKKEEQIMQKWTISEIEKSLDSNRIMMIRDFNDKIEAEKRQRNERIGEISALMDSNKNLINEHIRNQVDSLRSLIKALVGKESSERNKEYENIMRILSARIESVEKAAMNKIKEETEKTEVRLETFKTNFDALKEKHEKHLDVHDSAIEENSQNINDHYQEHRESFEKMEREQKYKLEEAVQKLKDEMEIRSVLNSMTEHLANEERRVKFVKLKAFVEKALNELSEDVQQRDQEVHKRIDDLDLMTTFENTVNKAALNALDSKYEQALEEVAESIDNYIGVVNDTSNKQYEDFNKNLKSEFGKNLEQIQDILNNLRDEIDGQKEKVNMIESSVNDVEYNNKKDIDKIKDKIEIERLVNELVSWVAEESEISNIEDLHKQNIKLKQMARVADKKSENALDAIKELSELREKDLDAEQERREKEKEEKEVSYSSLYISTALAISYALIIFNVYRSAKRKRKSKERRNKRKRQRRKRKLSKLRRTKRIKIKQRKNERSKRKKSRKKSTKRKKKSAKIKRQRRRKNAKIRRPKMKKSAEKNKSERTKSAKKKRPRIRPTKTKT